MKNYAVYFEIYGKKMKSTVRATSTKEARQSVASELVFHKVVAVKNAPDPAERPTFSSNIFSDIFNDITTDLFGKPTKNK